MTAEVRALTERDRAQVEALLARDPVENLFVASRVTGFGIDARRLGCTIWGFFRDNELTALCHAGANLVPVGADVPAMAAFAEVIGPRRTASSIMGRSDQVKLAHQMLVDRWGGAWRYHREVRASQPLMVIRRNSTVVPDTRVNRVPRALYHPYFDAAVTMYTEEVGVSPLDDSYSYRRYVTSLIDMGRAFGGFADGQVWFKSDIGAAAGTIGQVQGVWVRPELRGRNLSIAAMARVVQLAREEFDTVSLYVNSFNTRALRLYARVGFEVVGEMATVLY